MRTPQCLVRLHRWCPSSWPTMDVGVGFTGFERCPCSCHADENPRKNALLRDLFGDSPPKTEVGH